MSPLSEHVGWRPEVRARLDEVIARPSTDRPVAVFDFDNTCILGDIGELFSHYLIDEVRYRYDLDAFWELIDPQDGRDELRRLAQTSMALSPEAREGDQNYQRYLAEMGALYHRRLAREGKAACYAWAVRLHVGIDEAQMRAWSLEAIDRELARPVEVERRDTRRGEEVCIGRGIRVLPAIVDAIAALHGAGWEAWIVSATNVWSVRAFASHYGVPAERVVGNAVEVDDGTLTDRLVPPALFRQGKVEAIEREIGKRPQMVFGDSDTDFEMLCDATDLGVVIDHGHPMLRDEAARRGWAVQPQADLVPEPAR